MEPKERWKGGWIMWIVVIAVALSGLVLAIRSTFWLTRRDDVSLKATSGGVVNDQAVIVEFTYGLKATDTLSALEDRLATAINEADVGEFDGNEIAVDLSDGSLYMYGPDADALFGVVRPILEAAPFMKGATALVRYGPPRPGVRERKVTIGVEP